MEWVNKYMNFVVFANAKYLYISEGKWAAAQRAVPDCRKKLNTKDLKFQIWKFLNRRFDAYVRRNCVY